MKPYLIVTVVFITFAFNACKKDKAIVPLNVQTTVLPALLPEKLESVFFVDVNVGFVGGVNGNIYKTTNAGINWQLLNTAVNLPVNGIYFFDALRGIAVGGQSTCPGSGCTLSTGFIIRTQDGGQTWTKVYSIPVGNLIQLNAVSFPNSTNGYCIGNNLILKTTDGGLSWIVETTFNVGEMMQLNFATPTNGYVVCVTGQIIQTADGGNSWNVTTPSLPNSGGYYGLTSAGGAIYVSGQGKIIKSTNNGTNWSALPNSPINIYSEYFTDKNRGVVFGNGDYSGGDFGHLYGAMYTTSDGGDSWVGSADITNYSLVSALSFPTGGTGYGISGNAVVRINLN